MAEPKEIVQVVRWHVNPPGGCDKVRRLQSMIAGKDKIAKIPGVSAPTAKATVREPLGAPRLLLFCITGPRPADTVNVDST